jgi:hypothetical protein
MMLSDETQDSGTDNRISNSTLFESLEVEMNGCVCGGEGGKYSSTQLTPLSPK